jgi:uncharacterized protein (TIGR02646 family)
MIKIKKGEIPEKFSKIAERLTNELKENYTNGERVFKFTDAYRSDEVKKELINDQSNKCCFSEAKFTGDDAHVEHFRPKGRIDDWPSGKSHLPGYYWLAYEWTNLLLCKSTINCSYKRNFFPLEDDSARNKTHLDSNIENPLLIDPSIDDPREHIRFNGDEPYALTKRGLCSIKILRLRHSEFEEARRERLKILKLFKELVDKALESGHSKDEPNIVKMIDVLKEATSSNAAFSSMAIDLLQGWPHSQ